MQFNTNKLFGQSCVCATPPIAITGMWTGATTVTGQCYTVTGTVTIPTSVILINCQFIMSPNSQINVTGAGTLLTARGCCFKGTTSLWQTIDIAVGSHLTMTDCRVQDAWYG